MWTCPKCGRIFEKTEQPHSCHSIPLAQHFKHKEKAKELFDHLVQRVTHTIGPCKTISLPCCVHLFGIYDFLAALPKTDKLEIRIALDHVIDSTRLKTAVPLSTKAFKNCIDIRTVNEIDDQLLEWVRASYHLKG